MGSLSSGECETLVLYIFSYHLKPLIRKTFSCSCLPGYIGQYCDRKVDYCHPSPCLNGGSCISRNSSAVCTCATGFFGARCQQNGENLSAICTSRSITSVTNVRNYEYDRFSSKRGVYSYL
uniref:EGF-like domain-containing protein n=1 Tax=Parascaris equorum TaxID=6256 RepID=A0A914RJT8_PAREQ